MTGEVETDQSGDTDHTVRPKSSFRKGRTGPVDHVARQPTQVRSQERFELIVAATEELLQVANIEDISFYDIAAQAKISPASINYLFPTMASLRIEMSKRYLSITMDVTIDAHRLLATKKIKSWQRWMSEVAYLTRDYFNGHRPASEIVFGPLLHRESRRANIVVNDDGGAAMLESLKKVFLVPEVPGLAHKFAMAWEIADGLWSRSYILNGCIDDEAVEETVRIQTAYLRTVLPEELPLLPST